MIRFTCPSCQKQLTLADSAAGKKGKCPHCHKRVTIPGIVHAPKAETEMPRGEPDAPTAFEDLASPHDRPAGRLIARRRGQRLVLIAGLAIVAIVAMCAITGFIGFSLIKKTTTVQNSEATAMDQDLETLAIWCKRSSSQRVAEAAANPIRGKKLAEDHLGELRSQLLGKKVRWRFKIESIRPNGIIFLQSQFTTHNGKHRDFETDIFLFVTFNGELQKAGWTLTFHRDNRIENTPEEKLRALSVGEHVTVSGEAESVNSFGIGYEINIASAKIE